MSARSNSDVSSNASSPPSSINGPAINQVINNNNNPPKYGTLVPNRVFVGGIPSNTTEPELCQLFSKYGTVKATKIIADRAGVSKGYGFVTFETEEEAKRLQADADNIVLRDRRLNIAPAVKKQPLNFRTFESATSPPPAAPSLYYHNGMPYTFHNGMAYFPQTPNQGAPAMPTPEMPTVYQGSGFPAQSNAQSYGPTMMFPCNPNPTMFISPQPYSPYPHMPVTAQGPPPLMYTAGPNPTNQGNNTAENTQSVQMTTGPLAPYYIPSSISQSPTDVYFNVQPAPSQSCFTPMVAYSSPEGLIHFCDVPTEGANNIAPEDTYDTHTPERPLSSNVSLPETSYSAESYSQPVPYYVPNNSETPVVSYLSLQDDSSNVNTNGERQSSTQTPRSDVKFNVECVSNGVAYGVRNEAPREIKREVRTNFSRGRGSVRGRSTGAYKGNYAHHDNNNNHNYTEKAENGQHRIDNNARQSSRFNGNRSHRGVGYSRGNRQEYKPAAYPNAPPRILSQYPPHSTSPRPIYQLRPSHPVYPNMRNRSFQVTQVYHQRSIPNPFYPPFNAMHQVPPPPPPSMPQPPPPQPQQTQPPQQQPPRRYGNGAKKLTINNAHANSTRKLKTMEGMDSGAAGDGPVANMVSATRPTSPGTNKPNPPSLASDITTTLQSMTL